MLVKTSSDLLRGGSQECDTFGRSTNLGTSQILQFAIFPNLNQLQAAISQVADKDVHG